MIKYISVPPEKMPKPALTGDLVQVAENSNISCDIGLSVAAILYDPIKKRGGFFAVGGRVQNFAGRAEQMIDAVLKKLAAMGSEKSALECVFFGGTQTGRWQVTRLEKMLRKHDLPANRLDDVFGQVYRTFVFSLTNGTLSVSHINENKAHWSPAASALAIEDGNRIFSQNGVTGKVANATRFFRERNTFIGLREHIVPEYLESGNRSPLLIWSSCCSSGEETYSYAMYLLRLQQRMRVKFPFKIFGTDINKDLLEDAERGEYNIPKEDIKNYGDYFRAFGHLTGQRVKLGAEVRKYVEFHPFDIRNHPRRRFKVIICANVFQYYNDQARMHFMDNFISVCDRPGYIFVNNFPAALREQLGVEFYPEYNYARVG